MTKQEFNEKIKNGITAPVCKEIGAYRIGFYPFELCQTQEEIDLCCDLAKATNDFDEITTTKETIESLREERFTQIYKGIKYYFQNGQDLKQFCEMLEQISKGE